MKYTGKDGNEYDTWNSVNERIRDRFVDREVMCCMTQEIEFMLRCAVDGYSSGDNPIDENDYYNTWEKSCSECYSDYGFEESEDEDGNTIYKCCDCLDDKPVEIYEWWAVTNWFGEKLKEKGQVVIDGYSKAYWGRQCTGQAIRLDSIIGTICNDMEILQQQECSWEGRM